MFDQTGVPEYNLASSCDSYSVRSFFFSFFLYYIYVGCCARFLYTKDRGSYV